MLPLARLFISFDVLLAIIIILCLAAIDYLSVAVLVETPFGCLSKVSMFRLSALKNSLVCNLLICYSLWGILTFHLACGVLFHQWRVSQYIKF